MRKLFSLFAAMLVALTASAKVWTVGPNHNEEADRADCNLYVTLDRLAQAGDTILMADGTYNEPYSSTIKNNVVIMAAEGARPLIQAKGYIDLKANAEVIGIRFQFVGDAGNGYGFYIRENTPKYLKLEDCEFFDFPKYCVTGSASSAHCDSVLVNNCYFHNCANGPLYFPASSLADNVNLCDRLEVTYSIFANIDVVGWVSVIDFRNNNSSTAATSKLVVDHCTFYNCQGDYERLIQSYKSPDAHISNCIMMNPVIEGKTEIYATYLYGGEIHHNLNYQTKRQYGSGVTVTDSLQRDPMFADAAHGDFYLLEGSPALTAGSDGGIIGACPAAQMKTIYCKMDKGWWTASDAAVGFYTWDDKGHQRAAWPGERMTAVEGEDNLWKIDVNIAKNHMGIFTRVNPNDCDPGDTECNFDWGAKTKDQTIPTNDRNMFTITSDDAVWGDPGCEGKWSNKDAKFYITGAGEALGNWAPDAIPSTTDTYTLHLAAGEYRMKVTVDGTWDTAKGIEQLTTRADGLIDRNGNIVFYLAAEGDVDVTYTNSEFKLEGDFIESPLYKLYFATANNWAEDAESTIVWDATDKTLTVDIAKAKADQWQSQVWCKYIPSKAGKLYDVSATLTANQDMSGVIVKYQNTQMLWDSTLTLTANTPFELVMNNQVGKAGGDGMLIFDFGTAPVGAEIVISEISVVERDPVLADGYYLIGYNDKWSVSDLSAAEKFEQNPSDVQEYLLDISLSEGKEFKVVQVVTDHDVAWFPAEAGNYVVDADHAGDVTIYFRPDYSGGEGWHASCIYVAKDEPAPGKDWCGVNMWHFYGVNADGDPNSYIIFSLIDNEDGTLTFKITNDPTKNTKTFDYLRIDPIGVEVGADVEEGGDTSISGTYTVPGGVKKLENLAIFWSNPGWSGRWMVQNLTIDLENDTFCEKDPDTPTAIDNATIAEKAQKFIENGQLFIELNGVRYNVIGAKVR